MKMMIRRLAVAAAVAAAPLVLTTTVRAQTPPPPNAPYQYQSDPASGNPFYVGFDVGGTIMNDLNVKNGLGGTMIMDPGARASFIFGYHVCQPVALEFETAGLWNRVKNVSGINVGDFGNRLDLFQMPFMGNLVYCVPLNGGFCWFIGAGCGGIASTLSFTQGSGFFGNNHNSDTDFTFAYQGKTGIAYCVAPDMSIDLSYKFLGTLDHHWDEFNLKTSDAYTHSFALSFTWHF